MAFILPYAPDATSTSFIHPKTNETVTVSLPCSEKERALIERVQGIEMVEVAPERPKKTDGDK